MLLLLLTACMPEEKACDAMAVASLSVTVVGPASPTVTYTHEGVSQPCESFSDDGVWVCGWEVSGELTVRVEAEGWDTAEETVTIEAGECHAVAQALTIELSECTAEVVPFVIATVAGSTGEALEGVGVWWHCCGGFGDPCDDQGDRTWACVSDLSEEFEVYAMADGHIPEVQLVSVPEDECHVITQDVEFLLDWGAD